MGLLGHRRLRLSHVLDAFLVIVVIVLLGSLANFHGQLTRNERQDSRGDSLVECLPSNNFRRHRGPSSASDVNGVYVDWGNASRESVRDGSLLGSSHYVDQRLKVIKDARSSECRKLNYAIAEKVTLITHFNDYQFTDLKNTIGSVLLNTNMNLIEEIIVVDDSSALDHIVQEAIRYFKGIPKARYLRNRANEPMGTAAVRNLAAKEARTNVLVFVDCWTVCNQGWLEPLVDMLARDPNAIAMPHLDKIHNPVSLDYVKLPGSHVSSLSWNLAVRTQALSTKKTSHGSYYSPAIRGNVFAVRKDFFFSIGAYDAELDGDGGGEHAELSIRAWLCTGSVKVVPCSRVGVLNLFDPVKVTSTRNVHRIAELWFDRRKSTVYRSSGVDETENVEIGSVYERKNQIKVVAQCKDVDWYLSNIATNMVAPSGDAVRFGILRVKTDRCSRLIPAFARVKLDDCKQEHFTGHAPEMLFEMTKDGQLKVMGKCLTTKDNAYILAEKCRPGDTQQLWKYVNEELVNVWCNFCAMHVTDPDPRMEGDKQIAMAQECGSDTTNGGLFKKWEFILP